MQSTGQNSTQTSHPVQPSIWTTASSLAFFFLGVDGASASATADVAVDSTFAGFGAGGTAVPPPEGAAIPRSPPWRSQGGVGREEGVVSSAINSFTGLSGRRYKQLTTMLYSNENHEMQLHFA